MAGLAGSVGHSFGVLMAAMVVWIALPLGLAIVAFGRRDL